MRLSPALAFVMLVGCQPELGHPASLVESERVLGVRADPAEAGPSDAVTYTSLVASPTGAVATPALLWSLCKLRRPVDENTPVSQACLTDTLTAAGRGESVTIPMPSTACVNFGPLAPPSKTGTLRPTDPDSTGGYYQPIRLDLDTMEGTSQTIVRERVRCDLAGASLLLSQAFRARYTANRNPVLVPIEAFIHGVDDVPVAFDAIPAGKRVLLRAAWSEESPESYPVFDPMAQTLSDRREALWVSWYATAGRFDDSTTGRSEADPVLSSDNVWRAPDEAGSYFLWLVLHDSRGGTDFASYVVTVSP
jgi:hypothetical protein